MPRYKLTIEYDGYGFVGWQRQENGPSVQAAIEAALEPIAGGPVRLHGAGRTDAGVHALGQVAHVDLAKARRPEDVRDAVNFHLKPADVAVLTVLPVGHDFHARFSATRRHYRYRILNRRPPPALARHRVWHLGVPLDHEAMGEAARQLVGHHDFTTFRSTKCQAASPVRTLDRLEVRRQGEEILIEAESRSFLHNQVRSLVGSLKLVGEGKWRAADLSAALAAQDRRRCGPVAPADGLYLVRVAYNNGD
ncbi:MAG: tRNA pseudouridine(38-40) synthase TruA [Alphaproteobacteria bacterium]|jgi:tRNA pseudouridine38-40 synthase|nr:tRNA pseudouridine(38-40) synthase TruA [Alphaproteobacteria bacterium]